MHPRNPYKNPPNFKQLAILYPEFRKFVKIDLSGKAKFNFQDKEALAALTATLLLQDFNLSVTIPTNRLIPTLPLRLNYILWIEDIVNCSNINDSITGVDIGTGASCVYPLLAAKRGWKMVGTELDPFSVECAKNNILKNDLSNSVTIQGIEDKDVILKFVQNDPINYTFSMCNPPFFSNDQVVKNRSKHRPPPKNALTGSSVELETEGGELVFIRKMFDESLELKEKIRIYTVMVGCKCDFMLLKKDLERLNVYGKATTEFVQGNTTRWGIAWTFDPLIKFPKLLEKRKGIKKKEKPLEYKLPNDWEVTEALNGIKKMLNDLEITTKVEKLDKNWTIYAEAFEKNWLHLRRKKRENLNTKESPPSKKVKVELPTTPILKFIVVLHQNDELLMELYFICGDAGKEGLHQVLQYIKNNVEK